ncbi:ArsR/SmtB family transcription factor [Agrococcus sp. KRD186]|jgi:DNA-binding transcriptional ArsR family regulator|uniref:ArsR/SmtB family transcription factor n=1 Tax=Agrococcus sp. KRD186 TaxID=2729730 RepID=UPI0019D2463D|nr:metalloregulator ArsR/SmtB family transcription factor [Agrococcus sp. KRD186]
MTMPGSAGAALDAAATQAFAHLFQAFADGSRLKVLQHLALGEHRVRDLVEHLALAQSTVSKHVAFLLECGLVEARFEGRSTWYRLTSPSQIGAVIIAAEELLEATGSRHTLHDHLTAAARGDERVTERGGAHGSGS